MSEPATSVKIVSVTLLDEPWSDGKRETIATFSCDISGVRLHGFRLSRRANGELRAAPPLLDPRKPGIVAYQIPDPKLRDEICAAAMRFYTALTGA